MRRTVKQFAIDLSARRLMPFIGIIYVYVNDP